MPRGKFEMVHKDGRVVHANVEQIPALEAAGFSRQKDPNAGAEKAKAEPAKKDTKE